MAYTPINITAGSSGTIVVFPNPIAGTGTIDMETSGVVAGTYTLIGGDIDAYGRFTSVSSATSLPAVSGVNSIGLGSDFTIDTDVGHMILLNKRVVLGAGQVNARTPVIGNYSIAVTDYILGVNSLSAPVTLTLPATLGLLEGTTFIIKDEDGTAGGPNTITIEGNSSETIDGNLNVVISSGYQSITLYNNGSQWSII